MNMKIRKKILQIGENAVLSGEVKYEIAFLLSFRRHPPSGQWNFPSVEILLFVGKDVALKLNR